MPGGGKILRFLGEADGLTSLNTTSNAVLQSGTMLLGTAGGLLEFESGRLGALRVRRILTSRDGLPDDGVSALSEDPAGNIWIGAMTKVLASLHDSGFEVLDGFGAPGEMVRAFADDPAGKTCGLVFVHDQGLQMRCVADDDRLEGIATDLHDDPGSNISQISILSQLALRQSKTKDHGAFASVGRIGSDARRQVCLVFKEALNNALRHSSASTVAVSLRRVDYAGGHTRGPGLILSISGDGRGIDAGDSSRTGPAPVPSAIC